MRRFFALLARWYRAWSIHVHEMGNANQHFDMMDD